MIDELSDWHIMLARKTWLALACFWPTLHQITLTRLACNSNSSGGAKRHCFGSHVVLQVRELHGLGEWGELVGRGPWPVSQVGEGAPWPKWGVGVMGRGWEGCGWWVMCGVTF